MKRTYEQDIEALPFRPGSRLIVRLVGEMQLSCVIETVRVIEEHLGRRVPFDRALFLLMILREGRRFRAASTGLVSASAECVDGISVNAVAMSLGRPFETVRRHVNTLIADGLCDRTAQGVVANDEVMTQPGFVALLHYLHDRMVALIDDLTRFDVPMPVGHIDRRYDSDATIAAAIDMILAPFEYLSERFGSWLELVVVNAVIIFSSRHLTFDSVLARRYADADTVPPLELRRPVSASSVSRALRMSNSTVRREIDAGIASGKLVRVGTGLLATSEFLAAATISRGGELAAARTAQVMRRLGPGGFRFGDPTSCYLHGRPPLAAFD